MELQHYGVKGMRWGVRRTPEQLGRISSPRNTTLLKNYSGPMYFITERKLTDKNLTPRVPSNYFTKNGYEDSNTKRVCFADDVGKCLTALSKNVSNKTFYVYKPTDVTSHKVYKPNAKAVPDSSVTGELWITDPVSVSEVGKIKCIGDDGKPGKKFKYGNKTAELYGWNYEWVGDDKMELQHHGVKGMKWGVRRYRNPDGSLTAAGRKRVSKEYKKASDGINKEFSKVQSKMYVDAHNKAADKFNRGESKRFNDEWEQKHGRNSFDNDEYMNAYFSHFDKEVAKNYNESLASFYKNSPSYKKAKSLVDEYGMTKWNDLARKNEKTISEVRKAVEKKPAKTDSKIESRKEMFKKHPDLYDDFGGPDQIDDDEFYEMVLRDKKYK